MFLVMGTQNQVTGAPGRNDNVWTRLYELPGCPILVGDGGVLVRARSLGGTMTNGTKSMRRYLGLAAIVASFFAGAGWSLGQDGVQAPPPGEAAPAPQGQPAARAVRLSSVDGQVQLSQGTEILAAQALANTPLFEGTQIATSDDGRAEVQFEDGSVARISPNSSLTLGTLGQQGATMQTDLVLNSGLGYFEIQGNGEANQIRVHFGNEVAAVSGFTVLRINLDYPPGEVAVFSGNAHVEGNTLSLDLHGGESVKLNGADTGNYVVAETIEPDSWDTWNSDRDQALTAQETDRTTATNGMPDSTNPAWSDLDSNGSWYNVPGQGNVWSPYEAESSGWDPYGCGSWMWTPRFGYMWVSCESWGYMPYAFGTWNYYDGFGWGWAPGAGYPWWGGGGWGFNIGVRPVRYRPPHRPVGGPRPGGPIRVAGGRYQPFPVIAVNRVHDPTSGTPIRAHNAPVTIAGNTIQPLHPLSPRPVYGNTFVGGTNHLPVAPIRVNPGVRYGFMPAPNPGHQGTWTPPANAYRPPINTYRPPENTYRPPAPIYRAPAPSAPSRPMPMGGGGGGGGAHPSGGGGSHPSGGGGHR